VSAPILADDILIHRTLSAMSKANADFTRASRGYWVTDSGVESYLQARIFDTLAEAVADRPEVSVVMEMQMSYLLATATDDRQRPDVALRLEAPRRLTPIEVKRYWQGESGGADMRKLTDWIDAHPEIDRGLFACILHHDPSARKYADLAAVHRAFEDAASAAAGAARLKVRCEVGGEVATGREGVWVEITEYNNYDDWRLRPAVALFSRAEGL